MLPPDNLARYAEFPLKLFELLRCAMIQQYYYTKTQTTKFKAIYLITKFNREWLLSLDLQIELSLRKPQ